MPLPSEIAALLPGHMTSLLNAQWDELLHKQKTIRALQTTITDLRLDLQIQDINTPGTPCYSEPSASSVSSSEVSHTLSDISTPSLNECFRASALPVPGFTPTRDQHSRCNFPWSDAPLHWATSERLLFYKLKSSMLYRRLWRLYAATNNFHSWYAINSAPDDHDLSVFFRECNSLHISLHQDNLLHLRYGLSGGWQDFLSNTLKINCCVGASPYTALPGAAYISNSLIH